MTGLSSPLPPTPSHPHCRQYPFTADRKMMSTLVVLRPGDPTSPVRLYVTGASEIVLSRSQSIIFPGFSRPATVGATPVRDCVRMCWEHARCLGHIFDSVVCYVCVCTRAHWGGHQASAGPGSAPQPLDPACVQHMNKSVIEGMASQSLRTLGLAYKDFPSVQVLPPYVSLHVQGCIVCCICQGT